MLKVIVDYPDKDEELTILDRVGGVDAQTDLSPVLPAEGLAKLLGFDTANGAALPPGVEIGQ